MFYGMASMEIVGNLGEFVRLGEVYDMEGLRRKDK